MRTGSIVSALAALGLALSACGGTPNRPDHGQYTSTGVAAPALQSFVFPRGRRAAVVGPARDFPCAGERTMRHLHDKGLPVEALPEGATAGDALTVVVAIEVLRGQGGYWNPFSGAIASAHGRTDISVSIHDASQAAPLWQGRARARAALTCADEELASQVQQLLAHIR